MLGADEKTSCFGEGGGLTSDQGGGHLHGHPSPDH